MGYPNCWIGPPGVIADIKFRNSYNIILNWKDP